MAIKEIRGGNVQKARTSPLKFFFIFCIYLTVIEILTVLLFSYFPDLPTLFIAIANALILLILLSPIIYLFFFRQVLVENQDGSRSNTELQTLTKSLEELVIERTNKLATSEAEQRAILESSADSIIRIDTDGIIHSASQATNRLFGYKPPEIIGKNISTLLQEDHHSILSDGFLSSLDEWIPIEVKKSSEALARKKDGNDFPVDLTISECIVKSRVFYVINIRDISVRKAVEEALRASEERYRSLAENSIVGIWQIAPDGRTIYVNPAMELLLESEHDGDLEGLTYHDFFTEESVINFTREMEEREFKSAPALHAEIIGKKGTKRNIKISTAPIRLEDGSLHSYIGTFTDITVLKLVEEDLREAKDIAEEATKLKDKYVSLVTHNLNGPLSTILGYVDLLKNETENQLNDSSKKFLELINATGENMKNLIKDILNISRFKSGQVKPKLEFIDARDTVYSTLKNLDVLAEKKGINISNDIEEGKKIYADFRLFSEVLHNLVSNSIKFCDKGDSITILIPENEDSTIAVKDTGPGIKPDRLDTLFQYEERTSTAGTAGEIGTGFGLPISNDIMKAHGGSLNVKSTPGEGSIFFARLPTA
jgi:PAS domain S-box-containing protein